MSKPIRGIRNLIDKIIDALVRCVKWGISGEAKLEIEGELDWTSEDEVVIRGRPKHPQIEKVVDLQAGYEKESLASQGADIRLTITMRTTDHTILKEDEA